MLLILREKRYYRIYSNKELCNVILLYCQDFWDERKNVESELQEAEEKKRQYDESDFLFYIKNSGATSYYIFTLLYMQYRTQTFFDSSSFDF